MTIVFLKVLVNDIHNLFAVLEVVQVGLYSKHRTIKWRIMHSSLWCESLCLVYPCNLMTKLICDDLLVLFIGEINTFQHEIFAYRDE